MYVCAQAIGRGNIGNMGEYCRYKYVYISVCVCVYLFVCVCVCASDWQKEYREYGRLLSVQTCVYKCVCVFVLVYVRMCVCKRLAEGI